jgi:hypothetical protein
MTDEEANAILLRDPHGDDPPTQVEILRARAQMWRGASTPMMREHAWYIEAAADRIEELEMQVSALEGAALEVDWH